MHTLCFKSRLSSKPTALIDNAKYKTQISHLPIHQFPCSQFSLYKNNIDLNIYWKWSIKFLFQITCITDTSIMFEWQYIIMMKEIGYWHKNADDGLCHINELKSITNPNRHNNNPESTIIVKSASLQQIKS